MGDLRKIGDGNADADRAMDYWDCIPADCMRNTDGAADSLPPGITFMFGVVYWIMCAITVVSAWGPAALILGVLFGFAGPSAMAPMIYLISADWGNLALFLVLTALMMAGGAGSMKAYEVSQVT